MPLHEYECQNCRKVFEELISWTADPAEPVACPDCGSPKTSRLLSAPSLGTGTHGGGGGSCAPRGGFS